jgi:hypothetical protein
MKRMKNIRTILVTAVTISIAALFSAQADPPVAVEINAAPVPREYRAFFDPIYPDFKAAIKASGETPYPFLISAAMTESFCERFDKKFFAALEELLSSEKDKILKPLLPQLYQNRHVKKIMHKRALPNALEISDKNGGMLANNFAAAVILTNALAADSGTFSQYLKLQKIYAAISSPLVGITPESIRKLVGSEDIDSVLESEQETRALFDELIFSIEYLHRRERQNQSKQPHIFYFMPYRVDRRQELVKKHNLLPDYFDNLAVALENEGPFGPDKAGSLNSIVNYAFRSLIGFGNNTNNCAISMDQKYQGRLFGIQKRKYQKQHLVKEGPLPLGNKISLRIGPLPQYYLHRAQGYDLLKRALEETLELKLLNSLQITEDGKSEKAYEKLEQMRSLMYGLYISASEQMGISARLDNFNTRDIVTFKQAALKWTRKNAKAEMADYDVRDIVPVGEFQSGLKRYRAYLCTFGLGLDLVEIITADGDGVGDSAVYITASPRRETVLIRDTIRPYSRAQFKKLCDKYPSRDAVVAALVTEGKGPAMRTVLRMLTGLIVIAGAIVFFQLHKKNDG